MTAANHLKLHNPIHADPAAVLTRLLRILCRSLPMYLRDARPWSAVEGDPTLAALAAIVADQERFACRTAQAILDQGGQPEPGPFPMEFASMNDAGLDYLLGQVIESQRRDLPRIEPAPPSWPTFPPSAPGRGSAGQRPAAPRHLGKDRRGARKAGKGLASRRVDPRGCVASAIRQVYSLAANSSKSSVFSERHAENRKQLLLPQSFPSTSCPSPKFTTESPHSSFENSTCPNAGRIRQR